MNIIKVFKNVSMMLIVQPKLYIRNEKNKNIMKIYLYFFSQVTLENIKAFRCIHDYNNKLARILH